MTADTAVEQGASRRRRLGWIAGAAALVAVVVVVTRVSEPRAFVKLIERAQPWWVSATLALQAATYVALASLWRMVARAGGYSLALRQTLQVALAKQFVDQTLPSMGISGGMFLVTSLERMQLSRAVVAATVVVDLAAYYFAYAIGLGLAILIATAAGYAGLVVVIPACAFVLVAVAFAVGVRALSQGRRVPNIPGVQRVKRWLTRADGRLTADRGLLARAVTWHLSIVVLDGVTMWTLLRAVGSPAPIAGVFTSFMLASLARTLSIIPGGLGVFEGVGVLALHHVGVPVAAALSATVLFRGFSYWLPMIPGFIASRQLRRAHRAVSAPRAAG